MKALDGSPRFRFSFAGGGSRRKELETWCRSNHVGNVSFLPYVSREDVAVSLGDADIGLVTLKNECSGTVVPSKVYGLLAAGRPILFIGPPEASAGRLVARHDCGWRVDCGDIRSLVALLRELEGNREVVHAAGQRARQAFEDHYDIHKGVDRISSILGLSSSPQPLSECISTVQEA